MSLEDQHLHPTTNASWLYEKAYFFDLDWERGVEGSSNKNLLDGRIQQLLRNRPNATQVENKGNQSLLLTTSYPGLLTGSGYKHELGVEGELKLGFAFDHTTGLPYIPGSTIKGKLRSVFRDAAYHDYVKGLLRSLVGGLPQLTSQADHPVLQQIEREVFEGVRLAKQQDGSGTYAYMPFSVYARDVFYDAFAISSSHESPNRALQGGMLGTDYLTPHLDRDQPDRSPFANPVPLSFLKVLPGVSFRFDFKLHDSYIWPQFTAKKKRLFFREILLDLGIGAKTNVGYGALIDTSDEKRVVWQQVVPTPIPPTPPKSDGPADPGNKEPVSPIDSPTLFAYTEADLKKAQKKGLQLQATVSNNANRKIEIKIQYEGQERVFSFNYGSSANFAIGSVINVQVSDAGKQSKKVAPRFKMGKN